MAKGDWRRGWEALTPGQRLEVEQTGFGRDVMGRIGYYLRRYPRMSPDEALSAAKAWSRNLDEQATRRSEHLTG